MKLRNLMYATMIACAFASCSKDDEVIDNGGATAGTSLDVKIAVPQTKSLGGESGASDAAITDIVVYVFENDKIQAISDGAVGSSTTDASRKISNLTAGTKKVLVLANCTDKLSPKPAVGTTLSELEAATSSINNEVNGKLSMNSQVYNVTLKAGVTNYLGYTSVPTTDASGVNLNTQVVSLGTNPVYLYRNVAKIVLYSVKVDANTDKYVGAKLTIKRVFLLHGAATSKVVGSDAAEWGSTSVAGNWINGVENGTATSPAAGTYQKFIETMGLTANTGKQLFSYLADTNTSSYLSSYVSSLTTDNVIANKSTYSGTAAESFYAFENPNNALGATQTLLVVEGDFAYGISGQEVTSTRYYTVAIGATGIENGDYYSNGTYKLENGKTREAAGVVRNIQYNIALTVKGPGYETPFGPKQQDNTFLDTQVHVVAFGTVNQSTGIE